MHANFFIPDFLLYKKKWNRSTSYKETFLAARKYKTYYSYKHFTIRY